MELLTPTLKQQSIKSELLFTQEEEKCFDLSRVFSVFHSEDHAHSLLILEGEFWISFSVLGKIETVHLSGKNADGKSNQFWIPRVNALTIKCLTRYGRIVVPNNLIKSDVKGSVFQPPHASEKWISLQESGSSLQQVLTDLEALSSFQINTGAPTFLNQLQVGVHSIQLLADRFVSHFKTTIATREVSPFFSRVEEELIKELGRLFGWKNADGIGVPGGSAANAMAVHLARHRALPSFKQTGEWSLGKPRIYVSQHAHYSFQKAAIQLGLGLDSVVEVPVDSFHQMRSDILQDQIENDLSKKFLPLLVVATAGTTVFGAFDPIDDLIKIAGQYGVWTHVDAAWGGPVVFSGVHKHYLKGIDQADSVTFDAHKLLGAPLTSSLFLTPHSGLILSANDVSGGDYLFHQDQLRDDSNPSVDLGRKSWQCGRRPDSFGFWLLWKYLGERGLENFVDSRMDLARFGFQQVKNRPWAQILHVPEYLNLCVRVLDKNGINNSLLIRSILVESGTAFVNFSSDHEGPFLRFLFSHPDLKREDLVGIFDKIDALMV